MRLLLARSPSRLESKHPLIIEQLLELARAKQRQAVTAMISMLRDLHQNGRNSRHLVRLQGLPLFELKTTSRGGTKGGSRIYLFINDQDEAVIINCEVKDDTTASPEKLKEAAMVAKAYWKGIEVVEGVKHGTRQD